MATLTPDRARALLGGCGELNGHDLIAGRASCDGMTPITRPRRAWSWYQRDQRAEREKPASRPGSRLIATAAVLLVGLGIGLLAVSYAAQYRYVNGQRPHQDIASVIEAGALDVGLIIFSLLALGLAWAGLAARVERGLIVACAAGSAVMNFAPAAPDSWRSVLAYCMPPVFLAVVVDRVVVVVRRHVLGMRDGRSPWSATVTGAGRAARLSALAALYGLRLALAPASTCAGTRRAILNATPLPAGAPDTGPRSDPKGYCSAPLDNPQYGRTICGRALPCPDHPMPRRQQDGRKGRKTARAAGTKTARFLELVQKRHGDLTAIPLDQVARIATALAPEAALHPASARTALLGAVRAALPAGGGAGADAGSRRPDAPRHPPRHPRARPRAA